MIRQAKSELSFTGKTVPVFLVGGGCYIDAVVELEELFRLSPVSTEEAARTPLFADAHGRAFTRAQVSTMVKRLMAGIGLDPARFGAHSLRIGGATAALSANVHPEHIRLMGRWASDAAELYERLTRQSLESLTALVGSTRFDDIESETFRSEDLEILPYEAHKILDDIEAAEIDDELIA